MRLFFLTLSLLLVVGALFGQESDDVDFQLWTDYNLRKDLQTKEERKVHSIGGDAGIRGFISNQDWNQFYIRPTFTYRFHRILSLAGAAAGFGTFNVDTANVFEFRTHQDVMATFPETDFFSLFYRLRFEQRFFFYQDYENDQELRLRLLIGIESPDIRLGAGKRPFYFQFFYESFQNLNEESAVEVFINQARPTFIFAHRLSPSLTYELNYIPQRSRNYSEEGLETTQNIFRIRVFHRIFKTEE